VIGHLSLILFIPPAISDQPIVTAMVYLHFFKIRTFKLCLSIQARNTVSAGEERSMYNVDWDTPRDENTCSFRRRQEIEKQ
jgi:hypothetical protein